MSFLKKLLLYRLTEGATTAPSAGAFTTSSTLTTSVTTTELSIIVANANGTVLMDEFYNTIFTGNGSLEKSIQTMVREAVPDLRLLAINSTDKLSKQRALVALAVKMQPFIAPLAASHPNLTAKVTALGEFLNTNRTGRDGGGGGYGGGWGSSCCCCGWGGGGGGGGGGSGWGNNDLLYLLLNKKNDGDLSTLLPVTPDPLIIIPNCNSVQLIILINIRPFPAFIRIDCTPDYEVANVDGADERKTQLGHCLLGCYEN
ncbi:hypothetical protein BV898_03229 [Hypsibius exemplaris]|uniref:Uncharacterized protein n=1 Tax=Hypsibius exemplaris TaxID=2072580 RepID=A0A1W0X5Z3_HYPEX|nr:hypothetical protein BV898_03229 [Hypsibius exemplaris]